MNLRSFSLYMLIVGVVCVGNCLTAHSQTEIDSVRKKQAERILAYQQSQQRKVQTRVENYIVSVPYTQQVQRQVMVPVRRQQYCWEPAGVLGRRRVLRLREVTVLESRTVMSSVTTTRSEQRSKQVQNIVVRFEKSLSDKDFAATNGEEDNGVNVELGPIPAASGPTFARMREFFDKSQDPLFEVPKKNDEDETLVVHSQWTMGKPADNRQARVTVAATPYGKNKILLTVQGQQILSVSDPENLTSGDFLGDDNKTLKTYVDSISKRINTAFVELTN